MEKDLRADWLVDYGTLILCPLEALFDVGRAGEASASIALSGEIILTTIKENIIGLIKMLEDKFGRIDVLYEAGDRLLRPVEISNGPEPGAGRGD